MSTTVNQVFNITMDLMDERTDAGTLTESDVVSYRVKTYNILNLLQAELLKQGDVFSEFSISNKPFKNELGYRAGFEVEEFIGTDKSFEANSIAKAYYFEADNIGTVYIEDYTGSWNTLATVSTTASSNGFIAYKGVVTPTSGATKSRIRFSGTNYYRNVNRALFNVPFSSSSTTLSTVLGTYIYNLGTNITDLNEVDSVYLNGVILKINDYIINFENGTIILMSNPGNGSSNLIIYASNVPYYRPWVKKTMPTDFKSVDQIVSEYVDYSNNVIGQYTKDASYKWEGRNNLYIDYYFDGNIRIIYHPIPTLLTFSGTGNSNTDLNQTLTIDDITARTILPYGLAAHLLLTENSASASFFNQRYEELKFEGTRQQAASAEQIINIYGGI